VAKSSKLGLACRAVNVLVTPMVRLGIGGKSVYLLTTTGHRTGQERTTPVMLSSVRQASQAVLLDRRSRGLLALLRKVPT
jgi:hypothetical protein